MKKLLLSLVIIVLLAMIGIGWGIDQFFENHNLQEQENNQSTNYDIIDYYKILGKQLAESVDAIDKPNQFIEQWNKKNRNKISLIHKDEFPIPVELQPDFLSGLSLILESDNKLSLHYYLPNKQRVFSFIPEELKHEIAPSSLSIILTVLFYVGVFSLILLWSYPLMTRLRLLRRTAVEFGSGDLSQRIELSRTSYISDIEMEFNRMAQRIESLVSDNKLISSAVSHDLRTPLARLRLGIDILSDSDDQTKRDKYQKRLSRDIDEMQSLVEVLLDYAKLEQALIKQENKPVDLKQLINDCMDYYQKEGKNILIVQPDNLFEIKGDPKYLEILFKNLVGNALKYCDEKIIVELESNANHFIINIHDDGKGVSELHRQSIFKPFIKYDSASYGMGLAIAERITHWHKGQISVSKSQLLGGAVFQVTLPLQKRAP